MAELLHHQVGGVGVQRLGDRRHDAELHQRLDDVAGAGGHAVGQFLHRDVVRQYDVTHDFHLIGAQPLQFRLAAFAFALAAHRGERADALVLALDGGLHVDAAGAAAIVGALLRRDHRRLARRHAGAGAADRTRLVVFLGRAPAGLQPQRLARRGAARALRRRRGASAGFLRRTRTGRRAGFGLDDLGGDGGFNGLARLRPRPSRAPASSSWRRASSSAALRASSSRRRASSAADRMEIFSCSRRSASRRAVSRCCSTSARWRAASSFCVSPRVGAGWPRPPCGPRAGAPPGAALYRRGRGRGGRGALLAHLHLDDFRPPMTEALPHGAGVHGAPQLQPSCRTQRKPAALAGILIVGFAHALSVGTRRFIQSGRGLPTSFQSGQPLRFDVQRLGQLPGCDCHMHHIVTPEHPS